MTTEQAIVFLEEKLPEFRRQFCDEALDEDALQLACLVFLRKVEKLPEDTNFLHYLYGIYRNKRMRAYEHYQHWLEYYSTVFDQSESSTTVSYPYTLSGIQQDQLLKERAKEYLEEIVNLRHRRICEQFFIEGYTEDEISKLHGVTQQRIHQIITRSVGRIKKTLHQRGEL